MEESSERVSAASCDPFKTAIMSSCRFGETVKFYAVLCPLLSREILLIHPIFRWMMKQVNSENNLQQIVYCEKVKTDDPTDICKYTINYVNPLNHFI